MSRGMQRGSNQRRYDLRSNGLVCTPNHWLQPIEFARRQARPLAGSKSHGVLQIGGVPGICIYLM